MSGPLTKVTVGACIAPTVSIDRALLRQSSAMFTEIVQSRTIISCLQFAMTTNKLFVTTRAGQFWALPRMLPRPSVWFCVVLLNHGTRLVNE
jgi:hypothetical protein